MKANKGRRRRKSKKKSRSRRGRKLTAAHKAKIARGVRRYHKSCKASAKRKTKKKKRSSTRRKRDARGRFSRSAGRKTTRTTTRRRKSSSRKSTRRATSRKRNARGQFRRNAPGAYRVSGTKTRRQTAKARRASLQNLKKARASLEKRNAAFKANASLTADSYTDKMLFTVKLGALALGGYAVHRIGSRLIEEHLVPMFENATATEHAALIGDVAAALIAVPLVALVVPDQAPPVVAGVGVSLLQGLAVRGLEAADQPDMASYLSGVGNYANAEGSPLYGGGMGAYYSFTPGQVYGPGAAMGEYYSQGGQVTYGELTQAAAGMGEYYSQGGPLTYGQLTQAAAGAPQSALVTAAAAGAPQNAIVTQAAAGEYLAQNVEAIGNYEQVNAPISGGRIYDGIQPNMHSAEQALDVVEAAAGDIPFQSTVDPSLMVEPIAENPGGSRAGVFGTVGGIFGGSAH